MGSGLSPPSNSRSRAEIGFRLAKHQVAGRGTGTEVAPDRRAIPHVGDKIEVEGWRLEIVDMDWVAN
jgi:hypothetical protein